MKRSATHRHPAHRAFSLAGMAGITLVLVGLLVATAFYARTWLTSGHMAAVISAVMVDLTNDERDDLGRLTVNEKLVAAAQAKADDMAEKGYFAHDSPDGKTSWHWFREAGYSFAYAGENLAVDFSDSEDVVDAWMDSPTHRANIRDGRFTEIGIATAVGTYEGRKAIYVVQMFGTPAARAATAEPVPIAVAEPEEPEPAAPVAVLGSNASPVAEVEPEPLAAAVEVPGAEPVPPQAVSAPESYAPAWGLLAASPEEFLRLVYLACGLLLIVMLAYVTRLEWRRHHLPHALAASAMIVVIAGLFVVADRYVFIEPTIGQVSPQERV